ncbi:AcrR family transcriptional regulator [Arthrobacter sp. CAN_A6]|uniref:TetR/AcrR family transcriptional regulator n=1 Tax=Arthrobacter sp. CAN_A6 TaxID=2787721 RepID=UPI0018C91DD6
MGTAIETTVADARERILAASYDLFLFRGVRAVGVNEIISTACVAKATFYTHFPSKEDLILAFLERRKQLFTIGYLAAESERRGTTPREQLLAIFEIFDEWFHTPDFTGCPYINALLEAGSGHPVGAASLAYLNDARSAVEEAAIAIGLDEPHEFAQCWMILLQGSVVAGLGTDPNAARRTKKLGEQLITLHTPAA